MTVSDETPLDGLDMSIKSMRVCRDVGLVTVGDLRALGRAGFMKIAGVGRVTADDIEEVIGWGVAPTKDDSARSQILVLTRERNKALTELRELKAKLRELGEP